MTQFYPTHVLKTRRQHTRQNQIG